MTETIRWGILGCGRIARKFASDLRHVPGSVLVAAGSRNAETVKEFAKEFQVEFMHDSYEALVSNPKVDAIYIASPHGLHYEHTLLCLNHGKAVLCEKAFALNYRQASEMIALAKDRRVFLMEALWTKFVPHFNKVVSEVEEGKIGDIQSMLVNFGFRPFDPIPARLFDPALGGGSLLDIGIYNVFLALSLMGRPPVIEASMTPASSGIDEQCAILFKYDSGALAQLFCSFASNLATEADINGNKGRIRMGSRFYEPGCKLLFYSGRTDTEQEISYERGPGFGYQYQASHVADCLRKSFTESPIMKFSDTLLLMETLDRIRKAAGIVYDADKNES